MKINFLVQNIILIFVITKQKDMKTTLDKSQIKAAKILGIADFNNGVKCVPCLSKSCMSLIEANQNVKGATIAIMNAWQKGWTLANLAWNTSQN